MARSVVIRWDGGEVSGRWRRPAAPHQTAILLAHGAGTDQYHHSIVRLREGLAERGHPVLTFNYPYTESGRKRPDRPQVLLACHRAAAAWLHVRFPTIVMAGRSMGGRMASYLAADGDPCAGLVLYSYPLHPAGKPEKLRKEHLADIDVPMQFFTGDRDALARPDLFRKWIVSLPNAITEVIADADHSFRVPKRSGRTQEEVIDWIVDRTANWVAGLD
jgi:predicted alpha/beta-hydrolase family hydrolase